MYTKKHEIVYKWQTITITAHLTQTEIANLLLVPGIHLISVNAPKKSYYPRKQKKKC